MDMAKDKPRTPSWPGFVIQCRQSHDKDGGTGFYRFPVSGPAEEERCQAGPRHPLSRYLIDLCGENEIALCQAVDFVRPDGDLDFAPGQEDVGMMSLLFGNLSHAIDEI
jgi:hypothetical protein